MNMAGYLTCLVLMSPCIFTLGFFSVLYSKMRKKNLFFLLSIGIGYAPFFLIPVFLFLLAFCLHGAAAAEFTVIYLIYSSPIFIVGPFLATYFAYKKSI
jgi:hypothetical protein